MKMEFDPIEEVIAAYGRGEIVIITACSFWRMVVA